MKKIIVGSLLVVGLATGLAYAHGNNGWNGGGYGGHMMGNGGGYADCPGAAYFGTNDWNSEKHQKFLKDTVELRKELNNKRFDYFEARNNPDTSRDQLLSMEKELIDIEKQIREKAQNQ